MSSNREEMRAVVYWQKEDKVGQEPLKNVVESGRFVNVATAKYSGDKKYYPVKVLLISDKDEELNQKVTEVEMQIEEAAQSIPPKRSRKLVKSVTQASSQEVARALGSTLFAPVPPKDLQCKVPVQVELLAVSQGIQKGNKESKRNRASGQKQLDTNIMGQVGRSLDPAFCGSEKSRRDDDKEEDKENTMEDIDDNALSVESDEEPQHKQKEPLSSIPSNLDTGLLHDFLAKYSNPMCTEFLRDLLKLMQSTHQQSHEEAKVKFLTLLPIPPEAKPVPLTSFYSNVKIPMAVKEQLKVDYFNKPTALARETLFALFGMDAFRTVLVTGRGNRVGSYGIPDDVIKSICCFVNRHINKQKTKEFQQTDLVNMINKRAPEWKNKGTPVSLKKPKKSRIHIQKSDLEIESKSKKNAFVTVGSSRISQPLYLMDILKLRKQTKSSSLGMDSGLPSPTVSSPSVPLSTPAPAMQHFVPGSAFSHPSNSGVSPGSCVLGPSYNQAQWNPYSQQNQPANHFSGMPWTQQNFNRQQY
ncbi:Homeobox protein DLL-3 [Frankliniella fusca]|uniref:Homeobox protein DLL-3 n=1 Tax=Frankliniella fusca TaxID=407009 RepID=A0AAE1HBS8_9NEOP|nr:Homeobox protein DLL-3 [Frankliniella fusca]